MKSCPSVIEPGAAEKFIALTHERVKARVGHHFGKAVPWLFTERFVLPCRDWCRRNGLLYGGHFDGDDDMRCNLTHGHSNGRS